MLTKFPSSTINILIIINSKVLTFLIVVLINKSLKGYYNSLMNVVKLFVQQFLIIG